MVRPIITEARAERVADRRVARRLSGDRAYQNAEDAETQAQREEEITEAVWAEINREYEVEY